MSEGEERVSLPMTGHLFFLSSPPSLLDDLGNSKNEKRIYFGMNVWGPRERERDEKKGRWRERNEGKGHKRQVNWKSGGYTLPWKVHLKEGRRKWMNQILHLSKSPPSPFPPPLPSSPHFIISFFSFSVAFATFNIRYIYDMLRMRQRFKINSFIHKE